MRSIRSGFCRRTAACLPALLLSLACASGPPAAAPEVEAPAEAVAEPEPPRPITSEEALADFEAAWKAIDESHFDPEFNGLDWEAIHDEYLPRAEAATDILQLRIVIDEMLKRLGQSHFGVIPEEALPPSTGDSAAPDEIAGGCGFDVRLREGQLWVTTVTPGGPAAAAGVKTGWALLQVGDRILEDLLAKFEASEKVLGPRMVALQVREIFRKRTYGEVGSTAELLFLDAEDQEVSLELVRAPRDVIAHAATSTLPTFYLEFDSEIIERDGQRVGFIHFTNWFLPMALKFDTAINGMRDCDGIVIDLRGNGGGVLAMCMGLAGHFFDERKEMATMQMHDTTMKFSANPRRVSPDQKRVKPYAGPLAVLIDEGSGSASEVFSGGVQAVDRARIFGETSAGAVLGARMTSLPSGDAIIHAMISFETVDGIDLEGRGVIPDEVVELRREDLLQGVDAPLEAALDWIATQHEN